MDDTLENQVETSEDQVIEAEEQDIDDAQPDAAQKPTGYDFVSLDGLDPAIASQIQARFDRYHRQLKESDKNNKELRQQVEQMGSDMRKVLDRQLNNDYNDAVRELKRQREQAEINGDTHRIDQLDDALLELKLAKREQERLGEAQIKQAQKDMREAATEPKEIDYEEAFGADGAAYMRKWEVEKNRDGSLKRPWAQAGHPDLEDAMNFGNLVFTSKKYAKLSFQQKLEEIDKYMGVTPQRQANSVLSSNLTAGQKKSTIKLTEAQRQVAIRMGLGKTEQESIDKYIKALGE